MAVKVIDKKKAKEDAYVRKNLRREGKLLQMVRHPNIIKLYEVMETENSYYLVTELCEGGDLMDHICSKKHLDEKETRKCMRQVISAMDYLHKAGILHRSAFTLSFFQNLFPIIFIQWLLFYLIFPKIVPSECCEAFDKRQMNYKFSEYFKFNWFLISD